MAGRRISRSRRAWRPVCPSIIRVLHRRQARPHYRRERSSRRPLEDARERAAAAIRARAFGRGRALPRAERDGATELHCLRRGHGDHAPLGQLLASADALHRRGRRCGPRRQCPLARGPDPLDRDGGRARRRRRAGGDRRAGRHAARRVAARRASGRQQHRRDRPRRGPGRSAALARRNDRRADHRRGRRRRHDRRAFARGPDHRDVRGGGDRDDDRAALDQRPRPWGAGRAARGAPPAPDLLRGRSASPFSRLGGRSST